MATNLEVSAILVLTTLLYKAGGSVTITEKEMQDAVAKAETIRTSKDLANRSITIALVMEDDSGPTLH